MQTAAIAKIRAGVDLLIVAPTGSGKTEAALFPVLGSLQDGEQLGIQAISVTPLRPLTRDMVDRFQRRVRSIKLTVAVSHGDTPPPDRRGQPPAPPNAA